MQISIEMKNRQIPNNDTKNLLRAKLTHHASARVRQVIA